MATQALATRDAGQVQRADNPYAQLRGQLENRVADFKMALPAHITPEKFQRTVLTAAQSNPDLLKADRATLITACMKAAQDGLLPDGREAAIVTFNTRKKDGQGKWVTVTAAQYMPMVFGLRKKILQSGEISAIETNVVYKAEFEAGAFIYEAGTEAALRHRPMLDLSEEDTTDDQIIAAYSVAIMKDGTKSFEVMRRAEINKVRQTSQTGAEGRKVAYGNDKGKAIEPKGPWVDWFAEMARKTVMRRHSKTLPMSGDLVDVEATDEALAACSAQAVLASADPEPARTLPPSRADASDEGYDPATGEVTEPGAGDNAAEPAGAAAEESQPEGEGEVAEASEDDAPHPSEVMGDELIERLGRAEVIADVLSVETDLGKHEAGMREGDVERVKLAIAQARNRLQPADAGNGKGAKS